MAACGACGTENKEDARICNMCGMVLTAVAPPPPPAAPAKPGARPATGAAPTRSGVPAPPAGRPGSKKKQELVYQPASVGIRFVATLIDGLILGVVYFVLVFISIFMIHANQAISKVVFEASAFFLQCLIGILYSSIMDSSDAMGTWGKQALRIRVTDIDGEQISFGRALGRTFSKIPSVMICGIGYIMAFFTQDHRALHDMMAGTRVVKG